MQYFKTVQLYFKSIINSFDILALSEHCLFEEQHSLLKTATDGAYNYHAASSCDNPCIASGQRAHGGVALLWRYSIDDFVSPIENIDSDRIVGIKYELNGIKPLFILSVYLPSSSHTTEEYRVFDIWADHFEELGTPDLHTDHDNNFAVRVSAFVANFYKTCLDHPVGVLSEPLSYEEVAQVCSSLNIGHLWSHIGL